MKLFYGGCGIHQVFAVAETQEEANRKIGEKLNAPFLPISSEEIDGIDGFSIVPVPQGSAIELGPGEPPKEPEDHEDPEVILHCKKCDFTTNNIGILGQHYKNVHPKKPKEA